MGTYLITYDLHDASREDDLLGYIRTGTWALISESSYAVVRDDTAAKIVEDIRQIAKDQIRVYVFAITRLWNSYGTAEVNEWLYNNMH